MAHIHVVIIGFAATEPTRPQITEYGVGPDESVTVRVANINPYLVEGRNVAVAKRTTSLCGAKPIFYGSMMIDKARAKRGMPPPSPGLIIDTSEERERLIAECPELGPHVRRLFGGEEFINGIERWCLWLVDATPQQVRAFRQQSDSFRKRIDAVAAFRKTSNRPQTRALAAQPTLFGEIRQPETRYLLIPKVSSESRRYIPIGFLEPEDIASGSALIIPGAEMFDFGCLSSSMHNAWMRGVAGRMKSDYQYSNQIVYNNFPWPTAPNEKLVKKVEECAQAVLDARARYAGATLADLYDPVAMPAVLGKAHEKLDRAVELCYRKEAFKSDRDRLEHLFRMYEVLISPIQAVAVPRRKGRRPPAPQ